VAPHYESILEALRARHGFVVPAAALRSILGFRTIHGWTRALKEGRVGVPTFALEGRRGRFALPEDVATYLAAAAERAVQASADESSPHVDALRQKQMRERPMPR